MRIPVCYSPSVTPQICGGFADVWKGSHEGKDVAAKVLRMYVNSDFERIRRVGDTEPFVLAEKLIMLYAAVLQRGCDMEHTPPSERAAVGRRDNGEMAFSDGLGVDAQWKYHPVPEG